MVGWFHAKFSQSDRHGSLCRRWDKVTGESGREWVQDSDSGAIQCETEWEALNKTSVTFPKSLTKMGWHSSLVLFLGVGKSAMLWKENFMIAYYNLPLVISQHLAILQRLVVSPSGSFRGHPCESVAPAEFEDSFKPFLSTVSGSKMWIIRG